MRQRQVWIPLLVYIGLQAILMITHLDWYLAHFWFELEGEQWFLRHHWLTQTLLHDEAHDLVVTLYGIILLLYFASFRYQSLKQYHTGLAYLALSLPAATLSVSLIKHLTFVDCPWSVNDFGGVRDYRFWLASIWSPIDGAGHCFPAAHASSAYMFFGLYFFSLRYWPNHARVVLIVVVISGIIFGLAQQLRGAHFISHDLTSALICWFVNYGLWQIWQVRFFKDQHAARS